MQRLGFIIMILPLYAETGFHYISFCQSLHRAQNGPHYISFCPALCILTGHHYISCRAQSLCRDHYMASYIYHSAALCRDWASLYIILHRATLIHAETGLHYISFCHSMREWASLYIMLPLYSETVLHYL